MRRHDYVTSRRKALLAYLAVLLTGPIVALTALIGLLASGEPHESSLAWADRIQAIAFHAVTAWVVLVWIAVRFAIEAVRGTRSELLAAMA